VEKQDAQEKQKERENQIKQNVEKCQSAPESIDANKK